MTTRDSLAILSTMLGFILKAGKLMRLGILQLELFWLRPSRVSRRMWTKLSVQPGQLIPAGVH